MKMQILPVFKDIFPNDPEPTLEEIIIGIPTDLIIKFGSYINGELYFSQERLSKEIKIFIHLIERIEDEKLRNDLYKNFNAFKGKLSDYDIAIFPLPHTLKLIEKSLLIDYVAYTKSTPEQDLNLLKAMLILNSEANGRTIQVMEGVDMKNQDSVYKIFWESLLPNSTLLLRRDLITSVYKSLLFLNYLESKYPKYLSEYLAYRNVDKHFRVTLQVFDLYSNGYNKDQDSFYSLFKKELAAKNDLIRTLSLDIKDFSRKDYLEKKLDRNFKGLRSYPIQKSSNEEYYINNWGFIVEKFYDGLIFDFYNNTSIREEKGMNSLENFKSRVGEEFSSPFFMNLMTEIFGKLKLVNYAEKERNEKCDYDYYIRIKNNVFIFEFKDILFPINDSFKKIKDTLDKKLISNEKESKKGINQLLRHITNFNSTPKLFDDIDTEGILLSDVVVHPIIVYTDHAFGMPGVNHYLNEVFQAELKKSQVSVHVNPLALISLDFFMEEYSTLQQGNIDLVSLINQYYTTLENKQKQLAKEVNSTNLEGAYSGFDTIIREQIPFESKELIKSVFFERIMKNLKPYVPAE